MSSSDPTRVGIAATAAGDFTVMVDRGYTETRFFDSAESAELWRSELRRLARAERTRIETYRARKPGRSGRWFAAANLRALSPEQIARMDAKAARRARGER